MHEWTIAAGLTAALAAGAYLYSRFTRLVRRARLARRRSRATEGEREAEALLEARGYELEARQPEATLRYELDGEAVIVRVRADLLVRRGGRRFLAEVKTGAVAPRLSTRATRRQLLEYAHAFDDDDLGGILLIDADRSRVHHVAFPTRSSGARRWPHAIALLLVGALLGVAGTTVMLALPSVLRLR